MAHGRDGQPGADVTWKERRLAFGGWAGHYDRCRPDYPEAAVRRLVDALGARATVVDLGSGTGRLVQAVGPDPDMRTWPRATLTWRAGSASACRT